MPTDLSRCPLRPETDANSAEPKLVAELRTIGGTGSEFQCKSCQTRTPAPGRRTLGPAARVGVGDPRQGRFASPLVRKNPRQVRRCRSVASAGVAAERLL